MASRGVSLLACAWALAAAAQTSSEEPADSAAATNASTTCDVIVRIGYPRDDWSPASEVYGPTPRPSSDATSLFSLPSRRSRRRNNGGMCTYKCHYHYYIGSGSGYILLVSYRAAS